jgi:NCS2 family nucleobase:cation symporter-2
MVFRLAIVAGLVVDIFPGLAHGLPTGLASLASSSFATATLVALLLNLLFRIGVKQKRVLRIGPAEVGGPAISDFLHAHGASWGARPEIVARASFAANQLAEAVAGQGWEDRRVHAGSQF